VIGGESKPWDTFGTLNSWLMAGKILPKMITIGFDTYKNIDKAVIIILRLTLSKGPLL